MKITVTHYGVEPLRADIKGGAAWKVETELSDVAG